MSLVCIGANVRNLQTRRRGITASAFTNFLQTPDPGPTYGSEPFPTIPDMNRFHMSIVTAFIGVALTLPVVGKEQDHPGRDAWQRVDAVFSAMRVQAEDPVQSLPDAYKLQFENDYVKVVRVRYAAGAKLPEHTHPPGATVYVYLNDSEGVIFRHVGKMNHVTRRPPVKTGGVRISTGVEEHHEAENTSGVDSEFLRVLLKTTVAGGRRGGRLAPSDPQFENGQMRISRLRVEPGQSMSIVGQEPALLIEVPSGDQRWIDAARPETITNSGERPMDLIRVDLLSKPTS